MTRLSNPPMKTAVNTRLVAHLQPPVVRKRPFRRGDDTVGNPHRAQSYNIELFDVLYH